MQNWVSIYSSRSSFLVWEVARACVPLHVPANPFKRVHFSRPMSLKNRLLTSSSFLIISEDILWIMQYRYKFSAWYRAEHAWPFKDTGQRQGGFICCCLYHTGLPSYSMLASVGIQTHLGLLSIANRIWGISGLYQNKDKNLKIRPNKDKNLRGIFSPGKNSCN